jgi:hypothetical protein
MSGGKGRCAWRWNVASTENNRETYITVLDKTFTEQHIWKLELSGRKIINCILINEVGGRELDLFGSE